MDIEDNLFMLAGPVKMHNRVLEACAKPAINHRSPEFREILKETRDLLKYTFNSQEHRVALISGSGTAGLECAAANLIKPGEKAISISNGKFGERLGDIAALHGDIVRVKGEWGRCPDLESIKAELEKGDVKAVMLCHNETSSAITNPAKEIGKLAHDHGALFVLDGITSIGAIPVHPKEWHADVMILGSQKCVGAPAGMSAVAVNDAAYEKLDARQSYYLDLKKHVDKLEGSGDTPYTPAVPIIRAMREAMLLLKEEGIENRWRKCERLGSAARGAVKGLGLELLADEAYASNTVTGAYYPSGITDKDFRGTMTEKHGVVVAGAQDHIKGKVFRVGHMGFCSFTDLAGCFAAVEATLRGLGHTLTPGSSVAHIVDEMTR